VVKSNWDIAEQSKMKILHLTSGKLSGGAAKGALRLHDGLLQLGVESYLCGNNTLNESIENLIGWGLIDRVKYAINRKKNSFDLRVYKSRQNEIFSIGEDLFNCFSRIDFEQFDIIHLHWVNYSMNIKFIEHLKKHAHVVWTLRDMWPFTGGCHYTLQCSGYKDMCGRCPKLGSDDSNDKSRSQLIKKRLAFENIHFVAISNWLNAEARSGSILQKAKIDTIYNSVDNTKFDIIDDKALLQNIRKKFQIDTNRKIVLTGAQDVMDTYKGPTFVRKFIELHLNEFFFVIFGANADKLVNELDTKNIECVGVQNEASLVQLYNVADYFLMCSVQEGFGKTIVESLSCGTPVITLSGGAPEEIVNETAGGVVWDGASKFNASTDLKLNQSPAKLRKTVEAKFGLKNIASQYMSKYCNIIAH